MPRFDVFDLGGVLALDVQPDLLAGMQTRIVAPLKPATGHPVESVQPLMPTLRVRSKTYVMSTAELTAVPCSRLGKPLANLDDQKRAIIDALDFMVHGFRSGPAA